MCDLIESRRPPGVLPILDDVCKTMHARGGAEGLDSKFMETIEQFHGSHKHFQRSGAKFVIKHYAGEVVYDPRGFGDANKNVIRPEIIAMLQRKGNDRLIRHLFPEDLSDKEDKSAKRTSGATIRTQTSALVKTLMNCTPHYVRCVKPNHTKSPLTVDSKQTAHQVKYLGLPENIRVRRAGFAYRNDHHRFVDRFKYLSDATFPRVFMGTDVEACKAIIKSNVHIFGDDVKRECQIGKTKVFIRNPETYFRLEKARDAKISSIICVIQRAWRRYSARKHFIAMEKKCESLYAKAAKSRRRASICRPFLGHYLTADHRDTAAQSAFAYALLNDESLTGEEVPFIRAIEHILDHHGDDYTAVRFIANVQRICSEVDVMDSDTHHDPDVCAASLKGAGKNIQLRRQVVVISHSALYLMETHAEANAKAAEDNRNVRLAGRSRLHLSCYPV